MPLIVEQVMPRESWSNCLFELDSNGGRFGQFWWLNSGTMPTYDPYDMGLFRWWGCFVYRPRFGVRYAESYDRVPLHRPPTP